MDLRLKSRIGSRHSLNRHAFGSGRIVQIDACLVDTPGQWIAQQDASDLLLRVRLDARIDAEVDVQNFERSLDAVRATV